MNSRITIDPDAVSSALGDRIVLVHLKTDRIFELNKTAARFWDLLSSGKSQREIQEIMLQEFEVTPEQLSDEISELVNSLQNEQFLQVEDDPTH